jgi:hypothetical protein
VSSGSPPPSGLDPDTLEKLRRGFPLSIDRRGGFVFDGEEITHPGVLALFRRGLDANDAGEPIVRVGEQWTYVKADDCVFRVLGVRGSPPSTARLRLDDGREILLDPRTLWEEPGAGLRCSVPSAPSGRPLSARFTNTAQMDLDAWVEWVDDTPFVRDGAERVEVGSTPPLPKTPSVE